MSHDLDSVTVLRKGSTLTGRIVDAAGRPIRGARVLFGRTYLGTPGPPSWTTNERGEFTLVNCEPGPSIITVQVEGLAPRIEDVRVEEKNAPIEIRMTEPGSILRVKVVDVQGKPIAGAYVGANNWRGHQTIQFRAETDRDGRFEWRSAPKDAVRYYMGKGEYMGMEAELTASEREQTVTLHPRLVISGRVTDAETGRPIPKFSAVRGWKWRSRDDIGWSEDLAIEVTGGQFTVAFDEAAGAFIRIDAPGYKSACRGHSERTRVRRHSTSHSISPRDTPAWSSSRMASRLQVRRSRSPRQGTLSRYGRAISIAMGISRKPRRLPTAGSRSLRG